MVKTCESLLLGPFRVHVFVIEERRIGFEVFWSSSVELILSHKSQFWLLSICVLPLLNARLKEISQKFDVNTKDRISAYSASSLSIWGLFAWNDVHDRLLLEGYSSRRPTEFFVLTKTTVRRAGMLARKCLSAPRPPWSSSQRIWSFLASGSTAVNTNLQVPWNDFLFSVPLYMTMPFGKVVSSLSCPALSARSTLVVCGVTMSMFEGWPVKGFAISILEGWPVDGFAMSAV